MAIWSREKFSKLAKGFLGRRKNCFRIQVRGVFKALQYQYVWRRLRRRVVKQNYIRKVNAGARDLDVSYNRLIYGLNRSNIILDRKILSELAQYEPYSFKAVVDEIKSQVKLPSLYNSEVDYHQALRKKLIYFGKFKYGAVNDFMARSFDVPKEMPDYFGTRRHDYPYFFNKLQKNFNNQFMTVKQMKKLPEDYYQNQNLDDDEEDEPEVDEDDNFKY